MSIWDGLIILVLAVAIFQGYRRGFLLRMTGWIGGVVALLIARPLSYSLDSPISKVVNGEAILAKWIEKNLVSEHQIQDFMNGKNLYQWLDNIEGLRAYRTMLLTQIESTGKEVYTSMTSAISHTIAVPIWQIILTFIAWLIVMFLFVVICRLIAYFLEKVSILGVIDSFLGAVVSLVVVFIVLIGVNTIALYFFEETTTLGSVVHHSFFAPFFKNIFELFIR